MPNVLPKLNATFAFRPRPRPQILQFGGGNFLRGFFDWKIDRMNEAAGTDWGIVILRSIGSTEQSHLNAQDGLYTVLSRGLDEAGKARSEARLVESVLQELSCQTQWDEVLALACDKGISVVVSNTTDAGIVYDAQARFDDLPAASFPGKVTQLLHARWRSLGGGPNTGLQFLACELSDQAGDELRRHVLAHATAWELEDDFAAWVKSANSFHNTLVDRIVSGFPGSEIASVWQELGYEDRCVTTAELYHSLVIEVRPDQIPMRIPLADWDAGTQVVGDVQPYKLRKVAILNGAHTAMCPLALLAGIETVGEFVGERAGVTLLHHLFDREIKPFVDLPKAELDQFADAVLVRFGNPHIRHAWRDISLNSLAKFKARNLDRLLAYRTCHGAPPRLTSLSLSALLRLDPHYWNVAQGEPEGSRDAAIEQFLSNPAIWGTSIDFPDIRRAVLSGLEFLDRGKPTLIDVERFIASN